MRTTDLFKSNRAADKITESIEKVFGKKLNLESFDLAQLEDARNKLRTQIHTVRSESGFNENLENDAFTQAQWMLDAINSEIAERQEFISDPGVAALDEAPADVYEMEYMFTGDDGETGDGTITYEVVDGEVDPASLKGYCEGDGNNKLNDDWCTEMVQPGGYEHEEALAYAQEDYAEQSGNEGVAEGAMDELHADLNDKFNELAPGIEKYNDEEGADQLYDELEAIAREHGAESEFRRMLNAAQHSAHGDYDTNPGHFKNWFWYLPLGDDEDNEPDDNTDDGDALASAGHGSDEDYGTFPESAPPTAKGERMVKHVKKGYAKDGKLTDKEKGIAYATAWKQHNKDKNESVDNPGEDMTKLREGEVQQATAVVTAKTMVDRVGRWIEELSGMENDQLIQLGDSIRDEMGQEQAKAFISTVAPAVQQALENLKTTRETLATGVRMLTGEEQGAELLGAEPDAGGIDDLAGPAEPDALNAEPEMGDEFAAAEPAVGGAETAGREKRESINYENSLLKVLAG
jgi:hypothetical protein